MGEIQQRHCYQKEEVHGSIWKMMNIAKLKRFMRGVQNRMTNVLYCHTLTTCVVHLVTTMVVLMMVKLA